LCHFACVEVVFDEFIDFPELDVLVQESVAGWLVNQIVLRIGESRFFQRIRVPVIVARFDTALGADLFDKACHSD
jgi:hypothetical protein